MKKTEHMICSKEAEIAVMAEKINNIDIKVDNINNNLTEFIKCADAKYATKEELSSIKEGVKTSGVWLRWLPAVIMMLLSLIIFLKEVL